ncbi:BTB/POZ domain-containing protein-like protein, partial [Tanacetum coccineum]
MTNVTSHSNHKKPTTFISWRRRIKETTISAAANHHHHNPSAVSLENTSWCCPPAVSSHKPPPPPFPPTNPASSPPPDKTRSRPTLFEMMANEPENNGSVPLTGLKRPSNCNVVEKKGLMQQRLLEMLSCNSPGSQFNDPNSSD